MKEFKFKIEGHGYVASVEEKEDNIVQVTVNGKPYTVEVERSEHHAAHPVVKHQAATPAARPAAAAGSSANIVAPLPGNITKILVKEGQQVKQGEEVMVMEAMKMENSITAEADCTVKKIVAQLGQSVNQGDVLIQIEGVAAPVADPAPATTPKAAPAAPAPQPAPAPSAGAKTVSAPLPGTITEVKATVGQTVNKGDVLVVLEAMKMANDIVAEYSGTVKNILVQQGSSVNVGDPLVEIA